MPGSLFISDLHLCSERPHTVDMFEHFMHTQARDAEALYILGDLFEAWVGDDDPSPVHQRVDAAIRQLVDAGIPVYFMHGNRDFLITRLFAQRTGCTLLADPTRIDLCGTPTLLLHGDSLCTNDHAHQQFRAATYTDTARAGMLARPLDERLSLARQARRKSEAGKQNKAAAIMDVTRHAVDDAMREYGVTRMIHGHTHRPAMHPFELDGEPVERIVLPEWDETGGVLICTAEGCRLEVLAA